MRILLLKTIRRIIPLFRKIGLIKTEEYLSISEKKGSPIRLTFYKHIIKKLVPKYAIIEGNIMFLDDNDYLHLLTKPYDPFKKTIMKSFVKRGDVVVDLGANIGIFTLLLAKLVGSEGKVYAFEPDTYFFNLLKKNVEANGCNNVVLEKKAVGDKNEKVNLKSGVGNDHITSSMIGEGELETQMVNLDDYFGDKKVDFIKMDIEGSEGKALMGMKELIKKNENLKIITEFYPQLLNKFEINEDMFEEMLMEYFECSEIDEKNKKLKNILSLKNIRGDLFCVKKNNEMGAVIARE